MANIARLGVTLGLDAGEFNKGIEAAGKKLAQLGEAAAKYSQMGAVALVAASAAALQYADELADVAKANDVAIGTVLKLSNALAVSGGKADDAGKMLAAFTKFIDQAAGGSLEAQKTAKMLGVSLKDLGNLSEEELLNKVVKNLGKMDDSVTRNAKGMEVFGKGFKGIDAIGFAEDMAKVNTVTVKQEEAIKAAADMYDVFGENARHTMQVLAVELGPVLKTTIGYLKEMQGEGNILGDVFSLVFKTIALGGSFIGFIFKDLGNEIKHTYENAKVLATEGIQAAIKLNEEHDAARERSWERQKQFARDIINPDPTGMGKFDMGAGAGWDAPKQRRETIEGVDPKAAAAKRELERQIKHAWELMKKGRMEELKVIEETNKALGEQSDIYRKGAYAQTARLDLESQQLDRQKEMFDLSIAGLTMRAEDLQLEQDFLQLEYKRKDAIEAINKDETLTREAKLDAIERENELYARGNLLARERNIATKATREGSFGEGFAQSAARFFRDMPTDLEQGASAFQSVMGNMESAIDKFVRTGKLGIKDLARSIIQDLISSQLRAQMTGIFKMLFPTMFPVSTGAGSMFELQNAGAGAFADGGNPPVGQASLVGERGPELFVPRTAGTIIPNNQLSNMGGTTMVTNNYINAIDTKSFEDRLLGSSNAVWAANQYAGKSLAVNRGRA